MGRLLGKDTDLICFGGLYARTISLFLKRKFITRNHSNAIRLTFMVEKMKHASLW